MPSYAQLTVGLILIAAVVTPFLLPLRGQQITKPWITISRTRAPSIRDIVGAVVVLFILVSGLYASFALNASARFITALLSPLGFFVCLLAVLPVHVIERFLFPLLRAYLTCLGFVIATSNLLGLIRAYRFGEIRFISPSILLGLDPLSANLEREPWTFWLVVIGVAATLAVVLTFFRLAIQKARLRGLQSTPASGVADGER